MKTANRLFFIAKLLTYLLYKLQYIELFNVIILPQRHTHSINFCLISLCLIISNHHLPCPFPLLGTDRRGQFRTHALREISCQFIIIPRCDYSMTVGLPYLNFTLAFLLQHKPLIFIIFFGKYSLMRKALQQYV